MIDLPLYSPQGLSLEIFQKRYARTPEETWHEACERVAAHVAAAENDVARFKGEFLSILETNLFAPGGRIMYGSGRPKGQLLNCFVIPTADSREGWGRTISDEIIIAGTGGGIGTNFSPIRPRGSAINGSGGKATGAVSLMKIENAAGEVIKAGGGRRTALMFALGLTHGDIEEFLDAKLDKKELNNANVSVVFDEDPEDFFQLVKEDRDLELKFRGRVLASIPAKKIWKKIVSNALKGGEPGLLNGYLANRMSNIGYFQPVICTNPCGEIWLCAYDCCCLGSLVLHRFVRDGEIDLGLIKEVVTTAVRFLDDVLTVNNYPLMEIKETCSNIRRVGLGVTGLGTMLLELGLKYNSAAALELVDKVMNTIKNAAYEASVDLAKEKGPFPKFDAELFLKGGFAKTLKPSLRERIREHGIRNCALLTIPPVGTMSMVCDCDSGLEPPFGPGWIRRFRDGEELKSEIVVHPLFRKFLKEGRSVKHFQSSYEISVKDHFEMQRTCQKHIDNAVSKTINLPPGTSEEELSKFYMEYLPDLKGVTVYPEGSRENQPITPLPLEEVLKHMKEEDLKTAEGATSGDGCAGGACSI